MVENSPNTSAKLTIDLNAIAQNWKNLNQISGCAGAAIKANAYGLGASEVAKTLYNSGCRDFFVANWNEAHQLKDIIPQHSISILNGIDADDLPFAKAHQFKPVLNTPAQIKLWRDHDGGPCDIMLDSGINRLGIDQSQINASLFKGLDIDILMSHLASADEDSPQNEGQRKAFDHMSMAIPCKRKSLANSAGIMLGSDYHYDLSRPGLSLYGGIARDGMQEIISNVLHINAKVLQVITKAKGSLIGYNGTYSCPDDMLIATAALGYADGYYRGFSNKGFVHHHGKDLPIIGRVSMDLITIDARKSCDIAEGDWVALDYDLLRSSQLSGMSQYELLTGLSSRFERIYTI